MLKHNFLKCIVTVLKVYCVGTEGICVYPIHVSTRLSLFSIRKLLLDLYCISSTSRLKRKRKQKNQLTGLPEGIQTQDTNLNIFRPNIVSYTCMMYPRFWKQYTLASCEFLSQELIWQKAESNPMLCLLYEKMPAVLHIELLNI